MSGHSKWHNIQKTKGAADAKRSAAGAAAHRYIFYRSVPGIAYAVGV